MQGLPRVMRRRSPDSHHARSVAESTARGLLLTILARTASAMSALITGARHLLPASRGDETSVETMAVRAAARMRCERMALIAPDVLPVGSLRVRALAVRSDVRSRPSAHLAFRIEAFSALGAGVVFE